MEEGCVQEQKRVALGRGHQDAEAIDAARQAPPPTLSNLLRFLPPSRSLSLSISLHLLSRPLSPILSSLQACSLCLYLRLDAFEAKTAWKNSQTCSTRGCSTFEARDQLFSPGLLDITLRFHGRDEYEL